MGPWLALSDDMEPGKAKLFQLIVYILIACASNFGYGDEARSSSKKCRGVLTIEEIASDLNGLKHITEAVTFNTATNLLKSFEGQKVLLSNNYEIQLLTLLMSNPKGLNDSKIYLNISQQDFNLKATLNQLRLTLKNSNIPLELVYLNTRPRRLYLRDSVSRKKQNLIQIGNYLLEPETNIIYLPNEGSVNSLSGQPGEVLSLLAQNQIGITNSEIFRQIGISKSPLIKIISKLKNDFRKHDLPLAILRSGTNQQTIRIIDSSSPKNKIVVGNYLLELGTKIILPAGTSINYPTGNTGILFSVLAQNQQGITRDDIIKKTGLPVRELDRVTTNLRRIFRNSNLPFVISKSDENQQILILKDASNIENTIPIGDYFFNLQAGSLVATGGQIIKFPSGQMSELLLLLAKNPEGLSKKQIHANFIGQNLNLDFLITRFRKQLKDSNIELELVFFNTQPRRLLLRSTTRNEEQNLIPIGNYLFELETNIIHFPNGNRSVYPVGNPGDLLSLLCQNQNGISRTQILSETGLSRLKLIRVLEKLRKGLKNFGLPFVIQRSKKDSKILILKDSSFTNTRIAIGNHFFEPEANTLLLPNGKHLTFSKGPSCELLTILAQNQKGLTREQITDKTKISNINFNNTIGALRQTFRVHDLPFLILRVRSNPQIFKLYDYSSSKNKKLISFGKHSFDQEANIIVTPDGRKVPFPLSIKGEVLKMFFQNPTGLNEATLYEHFEEILIPLEVLIYRIRNALRKHKIPLDIRPPDANSPKYRLVELKEEDLHKLIKIGSLGFESYFGNIILPGQNRIKIPKGKIRNLFNLLAEHPGGLPKKKIKALYLGTPNFPLTKVIAELEEFLKRFEVPIKIFIDDRDHTVLYKLVEVSGLGSSEVIAFNDYLFEPEANILTLPDKKKIRLPSGKLFGLLAKMPLGLTKNQINFRVGDSNFFTENLVSELNIAMETFEVNLQVVWLRTDPATLQIRVASKAASVDVSSLMKTAENYFKKYGRPTLREATRLASILLANPNVEFKLKQILSHIDGPEPKKIRQSFEHWLRNHVRRNDTNTLRTGHIRPTQYGTYRFESFTLKDGTLRFGDKLLVLSQEEEKIFNYFLNGNTHIEVNLYYKKFDPNKEGLLNDLILALQEQEMPNPFEIFDKKTIIFSPF